MNKSAPLRPILSIIFGPIGDTLITLALFDDILSLAHDARITLIASSNTRMIADLASAYPEITVREIPSRPLPLVKFLFWILSHRWSVLVPGTAKYYSFHLKLFFVLLSAIPGNFTVGFGDIRKKGGWLPFNEGLFVDIHISVLNNYRKMLRYILPQSPALEKIDERETHVKLNPRWPANFPYQKGKYFVVHMFGTRSRLSFPPLRWTKFLQEIRLRYPEYNLVLTGGKKDEALIRKISDGIGGVHIVINMPILEVAGLLENTPLYIGIDTGVTHLAAMLRRPSVIIGNNSNPLWWPRYNQHARILVNNARCTCTGDKNDTCRVRDPEDGELYYRCTYDIRDEDIRKAFREFVSHSK